MSGGAFDYIQKSYVWEDMEEKIQYHITNNEREFSEETINNFKRGLEIIKKARNYIHEIDYLLSYDNGEENFNANLKKEND
jgi:hypothetical protein